ncbi:matrixin family metalloprotease [Tundrisphaera lichenicola]|uniref:matrixin family metalloprotease n=1 Tax=Tundrisphaera lichenicola TaxID=2029860 RepID=UPI003EBA6E64
MSVRSIRPSSSKSCRNRAVRPSLEGLEGRLLLYSTTGNHFEFGSRITWSIVPDGTNLGGVNSNLISTFNNKFGAGNWQRSIQEAFAIWQSAANINFVQVSDDGSATNSGNYQQGSPVIGDIRIGGFAQSSGILGFTLLPPVANGGSDSGDIFLNSSQIWNIGSNYDLESVMLHEIGHSLGLGHSTDTNAIMEPYYDGVQQYLGSDDINGIQSIWNSRQQDGLTQGNQNFWWNKAANLNPFINNLNQIILGPLSVTSPSTSYWMKVTTPANANSTFSVVVQSSNLSMLSPKVQIYNSNLQGLSQVAAPTTSYGAVIGTAIFNATPNTLYYIRVSASNAGPNGTGAYGLLVNMGNYNPPLLSPPNTQVLAQSDQGGGASYIESNNGDETGQENHDGPTNYIGKSKFAANAKEGWIQFGDSWRQGDYYSISPKSSNQKNNKSVESILIPIDPQMGDLLKSNKSEKKEMASVLIGLAHPDGML